MGFADYFLIVWDLVLLRPVCKGIAVGPGRGSSASSLVAYLPAGLRTSIPWSTDFSLSVFSNPGAGDDALYRHGLSVFVRRGRGAGICYYFGTAKNVSL